MMTTMQSVHSFPTARALRSVVVVSKRACQGVLETLVDAGDYDVVFVEAIAHAYSRIKHLMPSTVIVCLSYDDVDAFHLLSMLKLDESTSRIPVVTYTTAPVAGVDDEFAEFDEDYRRDRMSAVPLN
jgi:PleD family two-component response regulator